MDSPFTHPELFADGATATPARQGAPRGELRSPFLHELEFDTPAVEQALPEPARGGGAPTQEVASRPQLRFVTPGGKPYSASRWVLHQGGSRFEGGLDADGWTGPIDRAGGRFDTRQPFHLHIDGGVCCIVSGAALMAAAPGVEYGGSSVDWQFADDDGNSSRRSQFWKEYDIARRAGPGPQRVSTFLQHDHVMRRPVQLLARHTRAVFQVQPLSIRLGPIVRYTDSRRALIWIELETPGLVRITYGRASEQHKLPAAADKPAQRSVRHGCTVRVGGHHYALVCIDGLDADTGYQYSVALAPQPATGNLPAQESEYTEAVFPRELPAAMHVATQGTLTRHSYSGSSWLFVRTLAERGGGSLRFAHGSCRKYPNDTDPQQRAPQGDMLDAFGDRWLARKPWAEWPRFFLHSGDQIYADDVGVRMANTMLAQRVSAVLPGPAPAGALDIGYGAWAGRFGWRCAPFEKAGSAARGDFDALRKLRPRALTAAREEQMEIVINGAERARKQPGWFRNHDPRATDRERSQRYRYRILNGLLWQPPDEVADVPRLDAQKGLSARQVMQLPGPPKRDFDLEYPAAGDNLGVHAADYAEYAALYEQAFGLRPTRRLLAHLPSFMMFDDHEVTDDWNADAGWLNIVHAKSDPLRCWPMTMTDALCAYWLYQGWGNLAPEQAADDPRVKLLARARLEGRDALPDLRRLILARAIDTTAPGSSPANKLDWHFSLPTPGLPFHVIDLRTDRDVHGTGGMSPARLRWIEQSLAGTRSPVAVLVLPVPFLMPDPMLFPFRNPGFTAVLAGARSTTAFKRDSDIEHPAGNPVWDQLKAMLKRLQQSQKALKSIVLLSGDIHFSCNFDGQLADSTSEPRLVQLISSGLRQAIVPSKQHKLDIAYRGWLNAISRAQGVDEHRGIRITLGGLQGPAGKLSNFLFQPSAALVDISLHAFGPQRTPVPLIVQTHLASDGGSGLLRYTFRHMTQTGGSAVMSLKDPGFAHPTSPKDYPAAIGGIGIAKEDEESTLAATAFDADETQEEAQEEARAQAYAQEPEIVDDPEIIEFESLAGVDDAPGTWDAQDAESLFTAPDEAADDEIDEEIIHRDDRVRVKDAKAIPNRWICAIDVLVDNPKWGGGGPKYLVQGRGTGVLIGPRHVLTARHVIAGAKTLTISPARQGDNSSHPFGSFTPRRVRQATPYQVLRSRRIDGQMRQVAIAQRDDYALIVLDKDVPAKLGFWGQDAAKAQLRALAPTAIEGSTVQVTGYPGDTCGDKVITGKDVEQKTRRIGDCKGGRPDDWAAHQWQSSGTAHANATDMTFTHDADTYGGQSGSPIVRVEGGVMVAIGLHIDGNATRNVGVRASPRMLEELRDWINDDAGSTIASVASDALVVTPSPQSEALSADDDHPLALEQALAPDPQG